MGTHKRASDTTYMIKAGLLPVEAMTGVGDNDTYVIRGPAIMKAGDETSMDPFATGGG